MVSDTLPVSTRHNKRFLQPLERKRLFLAVAYLLVGALWILIAAQGTSSFHSVGFLTAALYLFLGISYVVGLRAMWWELRDNGIVERRFWRTRSVPYSAITIVGHWDGDPNVIEVRYASLDPKIFPQGSMPVLVAERTDFLAALRNLAPDADFRL